MAIQVYDWRGQERDLAYLRARYGNFQIKEASPGPGPVYKITTLWEKAEGDFDPLDLLERRSTPEGQAWIEAQWGQAGPRAAAALVVRVTNEAGASLDGVRVAFYWSQAPEDANAGPAGGLLPGMVPGRCDSGVTENGNVGFGLGRGAYYWSGAGEIGPHAVWVHGRDTRSDVILGLGMVGLTDHYHFDVGYGRYETDPDGGPGEEDDVPEFYDEAGQIQSEEWARGLYGIQEFHRPEGLPAFHLTGLRAASGADRQLVVRALDVDGGGLAGIQFVLFRRDVEHPEPRYQMTGADGCATFDMNGAAEHSAIDGQGNYAVGVDGTRSDFYNAAGVVMVKPRFGPPRWLNPTFRLVAEPYVPDPEEPPLPPAPIDPALRDELLARIAGAEAQLAEARALLQRHVLAGQ